MSKFKSMFSFTGARADEKLLVEVDCTQLEVCGLAEITGDSVLIEELNSGVDIHTENAKLWQGPGVTITPEIRKKAKVMTFQLQYGAGAPKMAETLGLSEQECKDFIGTFYDKYTGVCAYHAALVSKRREAIEHNTPFVTLVDPCGRLYVITQKESVTGSKYISLPELKNYPIQGFSTGGIVPILVNMMSSEIYQKMPMIKVINTVHDSIMFEVPSHVIYWLMGAVEEVFTEFPKKFKELFDYELKVTYNYDMKVGLNWEEMDKYSRDDVRYLLSNTGD